MLPDRVSNPGPLTYESGALPIALCGPALFDSKSRLPDPCFGSGSPTFREIYQNSWHPVLLKKCLWGKF